MYNNIQTAGTKVSRQPLQQKSRYQLKSYNLTHPQQHRPACITWSCTVITHIKRGPLDSVFTQYVLNTDPWNRDYPANTYQNLAYWVPHTANTYQNLSLGIYGTKPAHTKLLLPAHALRALYNRFCIQNPDCPGNTYQNLTHRIHTTQLRPTRAWVEIRQNGLKPVFA